MSVTDASQLVRPKYICSVLSLLTWHRIALLPPQALRMLAGSTPLSLLSEATLKELNEPRPGGRVPEIFPQVLKSRLVSFDSRPTWDGIVPEIRLQA